MPSTSALLTGLSGLSTNARSIDVIGNNISNVNTVGFKSNRMLFETTFNRNLSFGTQPGASTGGTNPGQIGLGSKIAGTQRNFNNGSISTTGVATDVAIEGDGFFVVEFGGEQIYSRNGAFQLNEASDLVSINGGYVMGYGVDDQFNVVQGALQPINVPLGTLTVAEATGNVEFRGNLNASGVPATTGSVHQTSAFYTDAGLTTLLDAVTMPTYDLTVPGNDLYIDDGAGGSFLALEGGAGTVITIAGAEKGGKDLGEHAFAFSATPVTGVDTVGTTIQDYMDFLDGVLGLDNTTVGGQQLGGSVSFAAGVITVTGNEGETQGLRFETGNQVASNAGAGINQPFVMQQTGQADGESVTTSFVTYDSLGTALTIDLTFVLQSTSAGNGSTWTYIAESSDNDALNRVVGLGTVNFDGNGDFVSASNQTFSVTRNNGAVNPLTVNMEFNDETNALTSLTTTNSALAAVFQDGSPIGTLTSFAITEDGRISGAFTNGLSRDLGQIAMANFSNNEGLVDVGNSNYKVGPNSGEPLLTTPLGFGTGRLIGGALELSNVDLSQEFINMILASTGYSAASRVITTTDELIDQLLLLAR